MIYSKYQYIPLVSDRSATTQNNQEIAYSRKGKCDEEESIGIIYGSQSGIGFISNDSLGN